MKNSVFAIKVPEMAAINTEKQNAKRPLPRITIIEAIKMANSDRHVTNFSFDRISFPQK